jgi:hypothetical protein
MPDACSRMPPRKRYARSERPKPRGSSASGKREVPSRHNERCRCMPEPVRSANGLGMNVAVIPRCSASTEMR